MDVPHDLYCGSKISRLLSLEVADSSKQNVDLIRSFKVIPCNPKTEIPAFSEVMLITVHRPAVCVEKILMPTICSFCYHPKITSRLLLYHISSSIKSHDPDQSSLPVALYRLQIVTFCVHGRRDWTKGLGCKIRLSAFLLNKFDTKQSIRKCYKQTTRKLRSVTRGSLSCLNKSSNQNSPKGLK